jgi:phospholipid/cholesterol/gamma-HCH transport system ATP-binding protein
MESALALRGVSKSFRTHAGPNVVLRDVTLEVPRGCLYGLIGPGAAGKSVALKLLAGLLKPDRGAVLVDGEDITRLPEIQLQAVRSKIGMLFQNNALFDHMTVGENIAFPLQRLALARGDRPLDDREIAERIGERLACVSLPGFESRMPAGLSGGQKKRVGVARATIARAGIVLYDEPAAGLDPVTSQKIFELLRDEQRAAGATVLMVSSDLDRLLTVTDRVGMLYRGELIFDGTTEEARSSNEPRVRQFVHGLTEGPL